MTPRQIATQYLHGLDLREQAKQLSQKMLTKKFERGHRTISKIANRMPCSVPEDEQELIRACIAERDRLKSEASQYSMPRLCFRYNVTHSTIENELISMGIWERAA